MAPKRKVESEGSDAEASTAKKKKPKAAKEPLKPLWDQPTNRTFPPALSFQSPEEGYIRLATWNVCGTKAADKKGLKFYLEAEDADIVCLTESKVSEDPNLSYVSSRYPHRYWEGDTNKKGYAGVAILSKFKPLNVTYGLPTHAKLEDTRGRMITLEFENHFLIGTYVPNAGEKLKNIDAKKAWNEAFEVYLRQLDAKKAVIWMGDINCAQTDKDLRHAKPNWDKTPGYSQIECDGIRSQLNPEEGKGEPLLDMWRHLHPDLVGHYTYYSYKFQCREKGIGWRLDTIILSQRISKRMKTCEIRQTCYGASDHVPVYGDLALEGKEL